MSDHKRDEYEQAEEIRKWLADNSSTILTTVALVFALIFGKQYYQDYSAQRKSDAAAAFQLLQENLLKQDVSVAEAYYQSLEKDFSSSAYLAMAEIQMAAYYMDKDTDMAVSFLEKASANDAMPELQDTARLRLARLWSNQSENEKALAVLLNVKLASFKSAAMELSGDIYMQTGEQEKAKTAYLEAFISTDVTSGGNADLEMKLENLGVDLTEIQT